MRDCPTTEYNLMENLKYFKGSFLVAIIGAITALMIGGMEALFLVAVLSVLEVSLSFDNAVVNATVLKDMDEKWRKRFITWGILIAVFGMRIVFPVVVVAVVAGITPWAAIDIAINNPASYADYMNTAHVSLMGFGGAFLMMVGLDFFLDDEKEDHWLPMIETKIQSIGQFNFMPTILTFSGMLAIGVIGLGDADFKDFITSGIFGIATFLAIHKLAQWMEDREEKRSKALGKAAASGGFAMFMYLEILDASFSFDGVIGAFAITTNLFIIAVGLGIGAMFVRSLTILFVEKDTLTEYEYLEHGAFYAIVALASIMMLKSAIHVPEVITGLIGAVFISAAFIHSVHKKKQDEALEAAMAETETKDDSTEMPDESTKDADFEPLKEILPDLANEEIPADIIEKVKEKSVMTSEILDDNQDAANETDELNPTGTNS